MALKKGLWSPEEDKKLIAYIKRYGIWNWSKMPEAAGLLRSGKSCRLRWVNYLKPGIKHGNFTREEEETILRLHKQMGNKWSAMAASLSGRTDNEIKNHWNSRLKKYSPRIIGTQLQGSNSTVEANQNKLPKLNHFLPNNALKSESKGSMHISDLESAAQLSSSLCSQNIDENFGPESLGENVLQRLQEQPLLVENSYCAENFLETFLPYCEMWCPEQFSPCGLFNDVSYDLWVNFSVPAADASELEESYVLFE